MNTEDWKFEYRVLYSPLETLVPLSAPLGRTPRNGSNGRLPWIQPRYRGHFSTC